MEYDHNYMISLNTRIFHYILFGTLMTAAIEVYLATLDYRFRILMNFILIAGLIKEECIIMMEKIELPHQANEQAPIYDGSSDNGDQYLPEPHLA
jgi:hypothetical protein